MAVARQQLVKIVIAATNTHITTAICCDAWYAVRAEAKLQFVV
jgi:hypothetical protein